MDYLHTINHRGQELRESSLEKLAAAPTTDLFDTRRYYNTTDNVPYMYIQGTWHSLVTVQQVVDVLSLQSDISCASNPNYPIAEKGWTFLVSSDGKIGGVGGIDVEVGDLIVAKADSPAVGDQATVGGNFTILERNLNAATETSSGIVRLATDAEATTGTTELAVPSVKKVSDMINNVNAAGTYSVDLLPGSTSYSVTHNLGGVVSVTLIEKSSGNYVMPGIQRTTDQNIVLTVNPALTSDHRVCVIKVGDFA